MPGPLLAHSWGWDEILYFAVPVVLAVLWVRWVEKRAAARKAAAVDTAEGGSNIDEPPDAAATMTRPDDP